MTGNDLLDALIILFLAVVSAVIYYILAIPIPSPKDFVDKDLVGQRMKIKLLWTSIRGILARWTRKVFHCFAANTKRRMQK